MSTLTTEAATFNTAVDTLMAALDTYIASLSGGETIAFVPVERLKGSATDSRFGIDTGALFKGNGVRHYLKITNSTTSPVDIPLAVGSKPLFWKLTNSAGDIT